MTEEDNDRPKLRNYQTDDAQIRNSGLMPRFGMFVASVDARAAVPLLFVIFHLRLSTLIILVFVMLFFGILEFLGLPPGVAFRRMRKMIVGKHRYVQKTLTRRRRMIHG
ncbi:MAG: IcmT/TraK family protein [Gammaproteobacteria bacterium]|nr:IcmT/TraK family protein [Gammaproteobacteria bacterium]